jgi:hypothetical protein
MAMNTTSLVVELVVIGAGAAVWVSLAVLAVFGTEWLHALAASRDLAIPVLLPALSFTYVLGILVDRLADGIFAGQAARLRAGWFPQPEEYRFARTLIYVRSAALRDLYEYGRSRLRICRGWTVNALLILLSLNAFTARAITPGNTRFLLLLVGNVTFTLVALWAWHAWRGLVVREYLMLYEQRNVLSELP